MSFPSYVGAPCGACAGVVKCDGTCSELQNAPCGAPPTPEERLRACDKDPRVVAGLVSRDVCTGADVFFRETFGGNGRTCASCLPVANNYTIDPTFVAALQASNPNDPLFVAKAGTVLEHLKTPDLTSNALILENVDGFQDPANRFVTRSVPHLFSLAITMARDPADGSSSTVVERTGWAGDGAPGDGSLRSFLDGAINQHFPQRLNRVADVDFRPATDLERDVVDTFQRALGRQNERTSRPSLLPKPARSKGKATSWLRRGVAVACATPTRGQRSSRPASTVTSTTASRDSKPWAGSSTTLGPARISSCPTAASAGRT